MADKPTREALVEQLKTPGWETPAGHQGTLEKVLQASHENRAPGQPPGLIRKIETGLELDAIQIVELWEHLGLPI